MSRGDVVLFLDADDYLAPHAAATALAAFRRGVAKVQFRLAIVDGHGRALGGTLPSYAFADGEIARHVGQYGFYVASPGSGNAFARSFLARVLPMPEAAFMTGADGYVGGLAPFFGEIVSLDDALASYRVHGANHSESGEVDVAKLRRLMRIDDAREAAQRAFLATGGEEPRRELALNIPGYCKQRLLSLLLEPASHPYPADTCAGLALKGAVSSWCFPHTPVWKRALSSAAFVALPVLPKRAIRHGLGWLATGFHRGARRPTPRGAHPPSPAHGAARSITARRLSAASASAAPRPPR
jgi:hypothetical protein